MERVEILINKLQEQLKEHADAKSMLVTVQMLNAELLRSQQQKNGQTQSRVSVVMPHSYVGAQAVQIIQAEEKANEPAETTQPSVAVEAKVEETKEINQQEEIEENYGFQKQETAVQQEEPVVRREHSQWIFDPIEAPTLAHQEKVVYELNESLVSGESSLNDRLKIEKLELAHTLHDTPIKDLKKAISINDRHRFIQDLFRGDETMYERSIKTINNFGNYAEAEFWMQRELKLKLAWDNTNAQVKLFDQLVRRRFA